MNPDTLAAILINELANIILRIESLPAETKYTQALLHANSARSAIEDGRARLHATAMKKRFENN